MIELESQNVVRILQQCLNYVDPRLIDHGTRVAYILRKMLQHSGRYDARQQNRLALLAVLHDIGAYKTEEIDQMVQFETGDVWRHSVYGYLFIRHLSPLPELAPAVLFHHTDYQKLQAIDAPFKDVAQMLYLADRADIGITNRNLELDRYLFSNNGYRKFSQETIRLFHEAEREFNITGHLLSGDYRAEMYGIMDDISLTQEEIDQYLKMLVYAIDFRSYHTVVHTMMTMSISLAIAEDFGLDPEETERIKYGALLHDIGKIAVPVEILEYPGKLSPQAMEVMKTHVNITQEILTGLVDDRIVLIASRHHEKLNGSGYPQGLMGSELSESQRIVAVADILSALSGTRSYKDSFDKDKILRILRNMADEQLLCPQMVKSVLDHYDDVMKRARQSSEPVLRIYRGIQDEYETLCAQCRQL